MVGTASKAAAPSSARTKPAGNAAATGFAVEARKAGVNGKAGPDSNPAPKQRNPAETSVRMAAPSAQPLPAGQPPRPLVQPQSATAPGGSLKEPAQPPSPVQPAALGFVGGAGGSAALSRLTQTAIEAARKAPPSPPPAAPQPGGLPGALLKVGGLALAAIAGRYTRSDGELNLLKDTGQIPQRITMQTMSDASRALDKAGTRPDMGPLGTEERGRFLEGAAVMGRAADKVSAQEMRRGLDLLHREVRRAAPRADLKWEEASRNAIDDLKARYGPLNGAAPEPARWSFPWFKSKKDDDKPVNLAVRSVVGYNPQTFRIEGSTAYVHLPREPGAKTPENRIVHRLVHDADARVSAGHEAIHLITGFGLDGKGASRIPAPFPMTALDVRQAGLSPKVQRNVNGIAIENITDAIYESLAKSAPLAQITQSVPLNERAKANTVLADLNRRTGHTVGEVGITQNNIPVHSDAERHIYELAGAGLGSVIPTNAGRTWDYFPARDNTAVHVRNFTNLLQSNRRVRDELLGNLEKYVAYVAAVGTAASSGRNAPRAALELSVSPETTRALIGTAIQGLEELQAKYPKSPAFPELINYYRSILERGEDGTPAIVQGPGGAASRTG